MVLKFRKSWVFLGVVKKGYANPEKMTDKDTEFLDIPMMIKDDDDTFGKEKMMALTLVKQLEIAWNTLSDSDKPEDEIRIAALDELISLLFSEAWDGNKGVAFAETYFDIPDKEIGQKLGISLSTVRSNRQLASRKFSKLVGNDVVAVICNAPVKQVKYRLTVLQMLNSPPSWVVIPHSVWELNGVLQDKIDSIRTSFSVKDCEDEIQFLRRYTLSYIEKSLSGLSKEKLAFLLHLMCSKDVTKDRVLLFYLLHRKGGDKL